MATEVIFYDLPNRETKTRGWSPNPWKARFALNYMKIPYKTEWVEYPDIAPMFKDFGLQPNAAGAAYTIPAARINGKYVMDSKAICEELQRVQEAPSLRLDSAAVAEVEKIFSQLVMPLAPVWMPRVPANLLSPASAEYFYRTRGERLGPLDQMQVPIDDPKTWEAVQPAIDALAVLLKENQSGPYVEGQALGFADIMIVTLLKFFEEIDPAIYKKFVANDKVFEDVYAATKPYFAKEN